MRKSRVTWKCILAFIINPTFLNGTCAICIKFTAVIAIIKWPVSMFRIVNLFRLRHDVYS